MKKILTVCGPTATGKTALALRLAKVFDGELVSADSRQVYKNMDIGTGKDLPDNSQFSIFNFQKNKQVPCYKINGINLWGYDLVDPQDEFSVSQYFDVAKEIIDDIHRRGKLPILVGGSGFYLKGVVDGIQTIDVPRNLKLREELQDKEVSDLYEILLKLNQKKALLLNESDRKNPRRIIRAIEIAKWNLEFGGWDLVEKQQYNACFIGLTISREILNERIRRRVQKRIDEGFGDEVKNLLQYNVTSEMQSMQTPGYKEWILYLEGKISKDTAVDGWVKAEQQYAKRQTTWFKKDSRISWYNAVSLGFEIEIENNVRRWYAKS